MYINLAQASASRSMDRLEVVARKLGFSAFGWVVAPMVFRWRTDTDPKHPHLSPRVRSLWGSQAATHLRHSCRTQAHWWRPHPLHAINCAQQGEKALQAAGRQQEEHKSGEDAAPQSSST